MKLEALVDTNVCIGVINGVIEPLSLSDFHLHLSVITCAELVALPGLSANEEAKVKTFFDQCTVLPISLSIALAAGKLCRTHTRKLPDMLIASTAVEMNLPLLTSDKAFRRIRRLQVITI